MDKAGTARMLALGIPTFITSALVGIALSHAFPGAFLVTVFGAQLVYSILYCFALYQFQKMRPVRPIWQFSCFVLVVQILATAATIYAFVA